jgi:hypothetical protein
MAVIAALYFRGNARVLARPEERLRESTLSSIAQALLTISRCCVIATNIMFCTGGRCYRIYRYITESNSLADWLATNAWRVRAAFATQEEIAMDNSLQQMNPVLQEVIDHHEIRKVMSVYCHGCDRGDEARMASVYLEQSWDDHGN